MSMSVCISKTTRPKFTKFSTHVDCGRPAGRGKPGSRGLVEATDGLEQASSSASAAAAAVGGSQATPLLLPSTTVQTQSSVNVVQVPPSTDDVDLANYFSPMTTTSSRAVQTIDVIHAFTFFFLARF